MEQFWTAQDRDSFIASAVNSTNQHGFRDGYSFHVKPVQAAECVPEDNRRTTATKILADTIYTHSPMRALALDCYHSITTKLRESAFTRPYLGRDIVVLLKGSNAYAFLTKEQHPSDFPFSDLDIAIYINPYLPTDVFNQLHNSCKIATLQSLSQHKRMLDQMFFLDHYQSNIRYSRFAEGDIRAFREAHIRACEAASTPCTTYISPFTTKRARNFCSKNSFMIAPSAVNPPGTKVVKIDVPHFEFCERIPLRKTPIFCSYNNSIKFQGEGYTRNFDLFRMRFNTICTSSQAQDRVAVQITPSTTTTTIKLDIIPQYHYKDEYITADFIDVSINHKDDTELINFWNHGRMVGHFDHPSNIWLFVPDFQTCITDIERMLTVYDSPECKKEKRANKLAKLKALALL